MHIICYYPYYSCLCTFWPNCPYLLHQLLLTLSPTSKCWALGSFHLNINAIRFKVYMQSGPDRGHLIITFARDKREPTSYNTGTIR